MNKIFSFRPYARSIIWGGNKIERLKKFTCALDTIGESWEISSVPGHESEVSAGEDKGLSLPQLIDKHKGKLMGEKVYEKYGRTFPLLLKIIDANADLSIQVHPNDALALARHNCFGKTEMWYIMEAADGAKITSGLSKQIDKDEYKRLIAHNKITDVLTVHDSHHGDVFFLPAGRIHAIGAGNLLLEIQQTSDITYRVYDYDRRDANGNTRQLHTEEAADAIDYTVYPEYRTDYDRSSIGAVPLVHCDYFNVDKITVSGCINIPMPTDSFMTVSCVSGHGVLIADDETISIEAGQTVLVTASTKMCVLSGDLTVVTASIP